MEEKRRVCIIGAGVSGLVACKYLSTEVPGWDATVVESKGSIGGVWSGEAAYATTRLQTTKQQYQFSDWAWDGAAVPDANPTQPQVRAYLDGYARHFGLLPRIRLNCAVQAVIRRHPGTGTASGWDVHLADGTVLSCHFLVLCCGMFGDLPRVPPSLAAPSPTPFQGTLMHALDYSRLDPAAARALVAGRRVVVVGFQKTAIDIALEVARANPAAGARGCCTLLCRRTHWLCPPSKRVLGVPLGLFFATRFAQFWVRQPGQPALQTALQALAAPARWLLFRALERALLLQHYPSAHRRPGQPGDLVPDHSILDDLAACVLPQLPPDFFPALAAGTVRVLRSPAGSAAWTFTPRGLALPTGSTSGDTAVHLDADVVIMCTGYDGVGKLRRILPPDYHAALARPGPAGSALLPLYRGLLHPDLPDAAFLGYQEGLSSVHSSELGARWLARYLTGNIALPARAAMEEQIGGWMACTAAAATNFVSRVCISLLHIAHADGLCRDIGWQPRRKRGFLADWFSPYSNADYTSPSSTNNVTNKNKY